MGLRRNGGCSGFDAFDAHFPYYEQGVLTRRRYLSPSKVALVPMAYESESCY